MERAGERLARVDGRVPQLRQPRQEHIDLELRALGRSRRLVADERGECLRGRIDEHVPGAHAARAALRLVRHLGAAPVGLHAGHLVPGDEFGAGHAGGGGEGVGEGAHAADGHVPVTGPVADHVVEEAAVLLEGRVVGVGERADQGVGEDDAAHQVVREALLDSPADRLLEEHPPGRVVVDPPTQRVPVRERLGEGGKDPLGDAAGRLVELGPRGVLAPAAREPLEGDTGTLLTTADEQPGGPAVTLGRGVRGHGAAAHGEVEPEIVDDLVGQQADQVRVPRQSRVDPGEGPGRDGGTAGGAEPLENQDGTSGPGEVGGGDEAVVASADDDDVVALVCWHPSW